MVPKCLHTLSVYNTVFWYIRKYSTYTRTPPRVVYLLVYTLKYTPRSLVYPNVLLYTTLILVYYSNMPKPIVHLHTSGKLILWSIHVSALHVLLSIHMSTLDT